MGTEHILNWIWLSKALKFGKIKRLHSIVRSADEIYHMSDYSEFDFLSPSDVDSLQNKNLDEAKAILGDCQRKNIYVIVWDSKAYPPLLRQISEPPLVLYAKGIIPDWNNIFTVGIVGTRQMSAYGNRITSSFSEMIAERGCVVVTGLALGNDIVATRAAIRKGKFTIALLGRGADVVYPKANELEYDYLSKNGLLLTERPPGELPYSWNFPKRNRILAGICNAVVVTEAPEKSGALITAHIAADEGRDVYAFPGNINQKVCRGTNKLIQEGVTPLVTPESFFDNYPQLCDVKEDKAPAEKQNEIIVSGIEKKIYDALFERDMTTDELMEATQLSPTECNSACFMLELKRIIERKPGNLYHREL